MNYENFKKTVKRNSTLGHFDKYINDFKIFFNLSQGDSKIVIDSILYRTRKSIETGAKLEKNDVNDSFILSHLHDNSIKIITFDERMQALISALNLSSHIKL